LEDQPSSSGLVLDIIEDFLHFPVKRILGPERQAPSSSCCARWRPSAIAISDSDWNPLNDVQVYRLVTCESSG
jgi:hypothetical protein